MEEDYVDIVISSRYRIELNIGDHITAFGRTYWMNKLPRVEKIGSTNIQYTVRYEGVQYMMARVSYLLNVYTTSIELQDTRGNSLIGDIGAFLDVMIVNLNRVFPGLFRIGTYPNNTSSDTLIDFDENDNCLSVLQKLCDTFDTEFDIEEQSGSIIINCRKRNVIFPYHFQYGDHKGLYKLVRDNSGSENLVNRLYVYGGSKNLTTYYMSDRLLLMNRNRSNSYIEDQNSIAKYGLFEGVKVFDDIIPKREYHVTSIESDSKKFTDSTMFDLNDHWSDNSSDYSWYLELKGMSDSPEALTEYRSRVVGSTKYLIAGSHAVIHFNSGNLAGYDFEVTNYNHSGKTFTIKQETDDRGNKFPSDVDTAYQISVGDRYTITNILLPRNYITSAQAILRSRALDYLNKMSEPIIKYELSIDEKFMMWKCPNDIVAIDCGDYVSISDSDFVNGVVKVRVRSVKRNLMSKYEYNVELEDINLAREHRRMVYRDMASGTNHSNDFVMGNNSEVGNGITFYPNVSEDGVLSWTNDGGLENPKPIAVKGADGISSKISHREITVKEAIASITINDEREYVRVNLQQNTVINIDSSGSTNEHYLLLHNVTSVSIDVIINSSSNTSVIGESELTIDPGSYAEVSFILDKSDYIVTKSKL